MLFNTVPAADGGMRSRIEDTALSAMRVSRGRGTGREPKSVSVIRNGFQTRALLRACMEYHRQLGEGLKAMVPLSGWAMRRSVIHMDYGPWIRYMVAEEDKQEALDAMKERAGRKTRNSGRGFNRTLFVSGEAREALAATTLVG